MYCQRLFTLLAASLSVTPVVLATPSFRFIKGGLTDSQAGLHGGSSHSGSSSEGSKSSGGHHGKAGKLAYNNRGCDTKIDLKLMAQAEKTFNKGKHPGKSHRAGPIDFPVHWHVIAANETEEGGWITDETIREQIEVLNESFDIAMFDWELVNVTRTINPRWFTNEFNFGTPLEAQIKTSLRHGDAATLNVWSANIRALGYATFPWYYDVQPELDGVVLHYGTVPGGRMEEYDKGFTLVHEVGHWLGLYHTFDGESCDGPGDYVSDTPQQAEHSSSCSPSDSCSHLPGGDPYTNFMDYSPDACLSEFTTGQIRRMRDEIRTYRGLEDA